MNHVTTSLLGVLAVRRIPFRGSPHIHTHDVAASAVEPLATRATRKKGRKRENKGRCLHCRRPPGGLGERERGEKGREEKGREEPTPL